MTALAIPAAAQDEKKVPYWASIASGEAMTRTGPARTYPGIWLYKRRDLPVRVVQRHENWRKIEDPDGDQGWMLVTLLSDRRTAMVKDGSPRDVRSGASPGSAVRYRVEAGTVGRIDHCDGRACHIAFGGKEGWIAQGDLYGLDPDETVE
jgi:SH3-like domain-containing protein